MWVEESEVSKHVGTGMRTQSSSPVRKGPSSFPKGWDALQGDGCDVKPRSPGTHCEGGVGLLAVSAFSWWGLESNI